MTLPRLRRSCLAVPASNHHMIEKAAASEADEVFIDLEDACAPNEKVSARSLVVESLTTLDFGHGFRIPDLDFRADFVPDRVNVVRLVPQKSGKFDFLCDNFCGNGHEEMNGRLIVE